MLQDVIFDQAKLKVIPVKIFERQDWNGQETLRASCNHAQRVRREQDYILFLTVFREDQKVLDEEVLVLERNIELIIDYIVKEYFFLCLISKS